jgi:hypothetical protein
MQRQNLDPIFTPTEVELTEAQQRVVEKEAHFVEVAEKHMPSNTTTVWLQKKPESALPSARTRLQKAVSVTAARLDRAHTPIVLFELAAPVNASDLASVAAILVMSGYTETKETNRSGLKIWKKVTDTGPAPEVDKGGDMP